MGDVFDGRNEGRIGEAAVIAENHLRLVVETLHRLDVENGIGGITNENHHIRILLLQLQDLRADIGRAGAVRNADRYRHVVFLGLGFDGVADRSAVIGVFIDDGNCVDLFALLLHVGEEPHISAGIICGDRRGAEDVFEAAGGDVERGRVSNHERNAVTFGHGRRREGARRLIGAQQRVDLVLRDELRRQLLRCRRIALVIDKDHVELGAAQIGQPRSCGERQIAEFGMGIVDDIRCDLDCRLGGLTGSGCIAGERHQDPDLHRPGRMRRCRRYSRCGEAR